MFWEFFACLMEGGLHRVGSSPCHSFPPPPLVPACAADADHTRLLKPSMQRKHLDISMLCVTKGGHEVCRNRSRKVAKNSSTSRGDESGRRRESIRGGGKQA